MKRTFCLCAHAKSRHRGMFGEPNKGPCRECECRSLITAEVGDLCIYDSEGRWSVVIAQVVSLPREGLVRVLPALADHVEECGRGVVDSTFPRPNAADWDSLKARLLRRNERNAFKSVEDARDFLRRSA